LVTTTFRARAIFRLPFWLLVTFSAAFVSQSSPAPAQSVERSCAASDLDVTFRFGNYQSSTYVVVSLSKNISTHVCALNNLLAPAFYTFGQASPLDISMCVDCNPSSNPPPYPLLLQPGGIAHQTIRWSTVAPDGAPACKRASVLNMPANGDPDHPAQLIAPSLLPPICSQVAEDSYALGPAFGDDDSVANRGTQSGSLYLFSNFATYHAGDSFVLHAESALPPQDAPIPQPGMPRLSPMRLSCPTFLLRQRAADGSTRVQEFSSRDYRCGRRMGTDQPAVLTAGFDAVQPIRPTWLGDTSVQISQLKGPLTAEHIAFIDSNPITLRVVDENAPLAPSSPNSVAGLNTTTRPAPTASYDGWKASFTLVDTSFGKKSALLDETTHLVWLRLSATRNKNEETLRRSMTSKKALDGWRFATDDEVVTLFRHFTGSPTGRTSDAAIVHELQSVLGGPLGHTSSTAGEWNREFTNGRIAGFYTPGGDLAPASGARFQYHYAFIQEQDQAETGATAVADPHRTGWIDGDRTAPDAGFFVVRER
jgi:hypothetical protein